MNRATSSRFQTARPCLGTTALLLALLIEGGLPGQGMWGQTPHTGTVPSVTAHAAAYDLAQDCLIAFGGLDSAYAPQATTTRFDGVRWTQIVTATAPSPRAGHAMAYDMARGRVVLFGGVPTLFSAPLGDTWEFDGAQWSQKLPANAPDPRTGHAMAYDVVGQGAVLFGGRAAGQSHFGDTWRWDGVDWAQVAATGPAPRENHAMSGDIARACNVMFGGFDGSALADTWEWNGFTWMHAPTASGPSPRSNHAMAFDFSRGRTVMHGGSQNGDETWEWDGITWTQHGSTNIATKGHVLVYDARLQRTTQFGGTELSTGIFRDEVQTYGHTVAGSFESRGSSCAGSVTTPQLVAPMSVAPGPMIGQTAVVQIRETWFHSIFVFGWSDTADGSTPLPFALAAYGMPGCSLQVSRDAMTSVTPQNGTATLSMPIPNDPFLVGVSYFVQGLALDPAANVGGYTTTNRIMATIGRH